MSKRLMIQLLLIVAGVFVGIFLWFSPRSLNESMKVESIAENDHDHEHEMAHEDGSNDDQEDIWQRVLADKPELKARIEADAAKAEQIADIQSKLDLYDSLIQLSIKNNAPAYVALFTEKKAQAVPTPNNWMLAGDNYFKAFRLSKNTSKPMLEGAVASYEKALEMDPERLQAKTALGVAYVEGAAILGEMPMKGIGMLKEVLNIDPQNVDALTNLGYFAIQSGQYDKAIERFDQVLAIDPRNAEAYLYLADVYLSQGDKDQGIETLEKYKDLMNDPLVSQRVEQYIEEIRSN